MSPTNNSHAVHAAAAYLSRQGDPVVKLDVRDLRLVQAVTEQGTLTRAGNVLFLTQSALSRQLADLEKRLGVALFQRSGRRMTPTPAGERLLEAGRDIIGRMERAEEEARGAASTSEAILRFATECYTCYHWLPSVLIEYRRRFPRVEPRIVASATRKPLAALLKGQLDLAVISTPVRDRRVETTPLFRDELVAVVSPDHEWAKRAYVNAADFGEQNVLIYSVPRSDSTLFREVLDPAGVMPRSVSRVELTEAMLELARAGLGVAFLARWAVAPCVQSGSLVTVRVTKKGLQREWSAAVMARADRPGYLNEFVELLAGIAGPPSAPSPIWQAGCELRAAAG
jgi:LysR family transcriptional regulator, regulator for metE and metH